MKKVDWGNRPSRSWALALEGLPPQRAARPAATTAHQTLNSIDPLHRATKRLAQPREVLSSVPVNYQIGNVVIVSGAARRQRIELPDREDDQADQDDEDQQRRVEEFLHIRFLGRATD